MSPAQQAALAAAFGALIGGMVPHPTLERLDCPLAIRTLKWSPDLELGWRPTTEMAHLAMLA